MIVGPIKSAADAEVLKRAVFWHSAFFTFDVLFFPVRDAGSSREAHLGDAVWS